VGLALGFPAVTVGVAVVGLEDGLPVGAAVVGLALGFPAVTVGAAVVGLEDALPGGTVGCDESVLISVAMAAFPTSELKTVMKVSLSSFDLKSGSSMGCKLLTKN